MSPAKSTIASPCTCAGMTAFSGEISPDALKTQAKDFGLSRNLPTDSTALASHMSEVRDDSLKKAQTSSVGVALTQQKLDALPDPIKSQPAVAQMSSELTESQTLIGNQAAEVYGLNAQLNDIEAQQAALISQKERIEVGLKDATPSLSADDISQQAQQIKQYQDIQKELSDLKAQHDALSAQYQQASTQLNKLSAATDIKVDTAFTQLTDLKQQAASLQIPQMGVIPQVVTAQVSMATAALLSESLGQIANQAAFDTLLQTSIPAMPAIPGTSNLPAIPAVPAIPQFGPSFNQNGIDFVTVPPGLFEGPATLAMPACPGLPETPEIPEMQIDASGIPKSEDTEIIADAAKHSRTQVSIVDIEKYISNELSPEKSALEKTADGFKTEALEALPAVPSRPELPPLPATSNLSGFDIVPLPKSIIENLDKFTPEEVTKYSAFWTTMQGKYAASQRSMDALKEGQASFQRSVQKLVDAQKNALAEQIPLQQYLDKTSGTSAIYAALQQQEQVPKFLNKFASVPETPRLCTQSCVNANIRGLFPDLSSPGQVKTAEFFTNPALVSTPGTSMISAGAQSGEFVNAHIANLEAKVQASGGKVASLQPGDLKAAVESPKGMIELEDKLKGSSLVTAKDMNNLSPQEAALLTEINTKMSSDVPVVMTTRSIGNLSTDPKINTAMIEKLAPAGSTVDARTDFEIPQTSVYQTSKPDQSSSFVSSLFKKKRI